MVTSVSVGREFAVLFMQQQIRAAFLHIREIKKHGVLQEHILQQLRILLFHNISCIDKVYFLFVFIFFTQFTLNLKFSLTGARYIIPLL